MTTGASRSAGWHSARSCWRESEKDWQLSSPNSFRGGGEVGFLIDTWASFRRRQFRFRLLAGLRPVTLRSSSVSRGVSIRQAGQLLSLLIPPGRLPLSLRTKPRGEWGPRTEDGGAFEEPQEKAAPCVYAGDDMRRIHVSQAAGKLGERAERRQPNDALTSKIT